MENDKVRKIINKLISDYVKQKEKGEIDYYNVEYNEKTGDISIFVKPITNEDPIDLKIKVKTHGS